MADIDCVPGERHDFARPRHVVGGFHDSPGVVVVGAYTITVEVCWHCGLYRMMAVVGGETTVDYKEADAESLAYLRNGDWPSRCGQCGHRLMVWPWPEPKADGELGIVWCGECQTRRRFYIGPAVTLEKVTPPPRPRKPRRATRKEKERWPTIPDLEPPPEPEDEPDRIITVKTADGSMVTLPDYEAQLVCVHEQWETVGEQRDWDGEVYRISKILRCTACGDEKMERTTLVERGGGGGSGGACEPIGPSPYPPVRLRIDGGCGGAGPPPEWFKS